MKKILIVRFSSLGDLVTLDPTFRAIKYFFKDDEVSYLTSSIGKGLYLDSGYFDKFIVHENYLKTISILRKEKYDIVINLQCNRPSHYITMMLKKDLLINKSFNIWQKHLKIKTHSKSAREILDLCNINSKTLDQYFIENKEVIKLPYSKSNYDLRSKFKNKVIAISTGTSERWLSKKWGINNFSILIEKLLSKDIQVVLVGTSLELNDADILINKFDNKIYNLVNKTNLTQLKNVLSEVDLFIGNDSGPAHIAAGVGTNTITIFGSTDIKHCVKFMPYQGIHNYCKPDDTIECHPCYKSICPTKMECMENIKVECIINHIKDSFDVKF
jgi:ADP-heptose:LPS heptosyltransferase